MGKIGEEKGSILHQSDLKEEVFGYSCRLRGSLEKYSQNKIWRLKAGGQAGDIEIYSEH